VFRKGVVGEWRNYLDLDTNDYCLRAAGPPLRRFDFC
jgi:hypothetical protein